MNSNIRALVNARSQFQKIRIAFENREGACEREVSKPFVKKGEDDPLVVKYAKMFDDLEKELTKDLRKEAKTIPLIKQMAKLNGIDFTTAAQVCSMIDIAKCPTVSSLWRYAGYGVDKEGNIDRLHKGEKACFNKRLKVIMHTVATNFLRCRSGSPFRIVYDDAKRKYLEKVATGEWGKKPGWKMRCHMAALRKVKKIFLATLWTRWRMMEGLPIRCPYVEEYKGHTKIYSPEDFGWPALTEEIEGNKETRKQGNKETRKQG